MYTFGIVAYYTCRLLYYCVLGQTILIKDTYIIIIFT